MQLPHGFVVAVFAYKSSKEPGLRKIAGFFVSKPPSYPLPASDQLGAMPKLHMRRFNLISDGMATARKNAPIGSICLVSHQKNA